MSSATPVLIILAVLPPVKPLGEIALIRFGAEPLLVSQLKSYQRLGIERAIIVANPENFDLIRDLATPLKTMQVDVIVQSEPKGIRDALLQVETVLGADQPIYVNQIHEIVEDSLHLSNFEDGQRITLNYPWHILDIMDYFLSKIQGQTIAPTTFIAPTASIVGNVVIGENVKIFPGAAVVGPAYIGDNTMIGNNSLVRASMVLDQCEVGFTTEIARSYVADRCAMHACRVLDSVFAPGVNFSAGCTTANLRIDRSTISVKINGQSINTGRTKLGAMIGRDAFLGVDVMTMPGVNVGERAQVGPGTHIHQDIADGQRVYVKQEVMVVDE